MSLDERLGWLIVGCVIGFVLGYIVRALQGIKEELGIVEDILTEPKKKNERGFMRYPVIADFALLIVVLMTVYAAFSSQHASNQVNAQQKLQARVIACVNTYVSRTITAANDRTTYAQGQILSNVDLQKAQRKYIKLLTHIPPFPQSEQDLALRNYATNLGRFLSISIKNSANISANPYPTPAQFDNCVNNVLEEN